MTDNQRENLSAGMDGELSKEELRFLLRRLDHDAALQDAWSRYHVARDGLRRQWSPLASPGFSGRVMLAIEQENAAAAQARPRRHWLHWSAGGAIAAGVAVAALMVAQPAGQPEQSSPRVASAPARAAAPDSGALASTGAPAVAPPGLNVYSEVPYRISQQASATLEGDNNGTLLYSNSLSPYRVGRYPASNGDGSYLLLIHPDQAQRSATQAPARSQ